MSIKRKLKYLEETKHEIRKALISRKVDVDKDDTFRSYANKIRGINVYDPYEGPYSVGPSLETIVMPTFDKAMTDNVTVDVYPPFEGSYVVSPSSTEQTLQSKNKVMTDNLIVQPMKAYDGSYLLELASIGFDVLPTKMLYNDGDTIDLTGAVVKAYYKNGDPWEGNEDYPGGVIPLSEITIDTDKAHFEGMKNIYEKNGVQALGILCDIYASAIYVTGYHCEEPIGYNPGDSWPYYFLSRGEAGYIYYTRYDGYIYGVAGKSSKSYITNDATGDTGKGEAPSYAASGNSFGPGASVSDGSKVFSNIVDSMPVSEVDPVGIDFANPEKVYYKQKITLTWERLGDGAEIDAELIINVDAV